MEPDHTDLPESHRVIRIGLPHGPLAELADAEAWRARDAYPTLLSQGPFFGLVEQEPDGRWRVLFTDDSEPQNCRDHLSHLCRVRVKEAEQACDAPTARAWEAGHTRMDWEPINELQVLDHRFRVIRGDYFARTGEAGPEPPRPTDPDPEPIEEGRRYPDRARGFLLDPTAPTGMSEGVLRLDFSQLTYSSSLPHQLHQNSVQAVRTHPGGVLLPPVFTLFERDGRRWTARFSTHPTPQAARDRQANSIAAMLPARIRTWHASMPELPEGVRRSVARQEGYLASGAEELTENQMRKLKAAVTWLQEKRADEFDILGHHYRVVRLERFVRMGPDGPEPPRPSDPDETQPASLQAQQAREAGLPVDEDEDE